MNKYKNFFAKYRVRVIFLALVFSILTSSCILVSTFLTQKTLALQQDMSSNFKTIITNSIVRKYNNLLTDGYSELHSNFNYLNQLVKCRAELSQLISGTSIDVILYGKDGQTLFDSRSDQDNYRQLLTPSDLEQLKKNEHIFYKKNQFLVSIFRISKENGEPFLFLKIVQKYYFNFLIQISFAFMALVFLFIIIMVLFIRHLHNQNNRVISVQHETNLKLENAKALAEKENINKSRFLANITHELRTPLSSIIGFSEIIKNESAGPIENPKYKEYVNDIYDSGVHLLDLVNDMLDLSKAEADKLVVSKIRFDLNKTIESCLQVVTPQLQKKKVSIEKIITEGQLLMEADPKRMKQVIINVLSNAIKFTPENGVIRLRTEKNTDNILIEISDTGVGIMQQNIYKVMSEFGQSDNNSYNQHQGTGLGLPLSKKLVELMGGTFSIKSEPQLGTTLTLNFPIETQDF
ncbi:HAMP domain-containing sensor histidine kinase [Candidatus Mesenet endosymbiont of Phosphuga atrata]|uniref:sensor histidine kinase n=1 Tax=Candidatus Mesenet endosymbiont of Phosphuga atrata TaxID=3066221 RepID=UPI0030CC1FB5